MSRATVVVTTMAVLAAGCTASDDVAIRSADATASTVSSDDALFVPGATDPMPPIPPAPSSTPAPTTTTTSTSTTTTTTTTTSTTSTSVPPTSTSTTTTLPPGTPAASPLPLDQQRVVIGTSVEGREIVAERFGTVGGRRVLVIGVIHGNEDAGVQIVDELRRRAGEGAAPGGVELWLVESMNPDGQLAQDRHNANQVDLNRNFPLRWGPIGVPGDGQYAGPGAASEPETRAMVTLISELRPDIALWYHQDANLIIPSTGRDGRIRARYAELTGLPIADCCDGGIYTGIAATWARNELAAQEGVAFIVELPGGELSNDQVRVHADAVTIIAADG